MEDKKKSLSADAEQSVTRRAAKLAWTRRRRVGLADFLQHDADGAHEWAPRPTVEESSGNAGLRHGRSSRIGIFVRIDELGWSIALEA
jgi:hypothetical protein